MGDDRLFNSATFNDFFLSQQCLYICSSVWSWRLWVSSAIFLNIRHLICIHHYFQGILIYSWLYSLSAYYFDLIKEWTKRAEKSLLHIYFHLTLFIRFLHYYSGGIHWKWKPDYIARKCDYISSSLCFV